MIKNIWRYYQTLDSNGKLFFIAATPLWLPFVLVMWLIGYFCWYLYYRIVTYRAVSKAQAPSRAQRAQADGWERQRQHRESLKAAPRPSTNTLYGGIAPTEKPLGD